jgi:hypothetical protein
MNLLPLVEGLIGYIDHGVSTDPSQVGVVDV